MNSDRTWFSDRACSNFDIDYSVILFYRMSIDTREWFSLRALANSLKAISPLFIFDRERIFTDLKQVVLRKISKKNLIEKSESTLLLKSKCMQEWMIFLEFYMRI